jgi:DNA end-binding protein Ku
VRAIWKGFISFGLVTIPVGIGIAQQRKEVSFRNLSRESMVPVRQKRWDPVRDVEIGPDEMIKGYEVSKGRFVTVEEEELERFSARQEKTIEILEFVDLDDIDPVYFERAYWVEPQERAERPYALLLRAMERSGRGAIGRFVLSTKEHLVLLRAMDGALVVETLYYPEDIRVGEQKEISERVAGVEVKDEELAIADQLIDALTREFDASKYRNETRRALVEFLEAKADGQEPVIPEDIGEPAPVVDLMAALKASLAASPTAADAETGGADAEAAPAPKPSRRRTTKEQLSIEDAKLRKVARPETGDAPAEVAEDAPPAAPARARRRKAS